MTDRFYKQGRHLMDWENDDLTLAELKLKLIAAEEGHEDQWLIDLIKEDIQKRQ